MRSTITFALLVITSLPAYADRTGGAGGGRLGAVSAGLATATATATASASASGGSGASTVAVADDLDNCARYRDAREHDPAYQSTILDRRCPVVASHTRETYEPGTTNAAEPAAKIEGFAGAEKVVESDGSVSVALAVVDKHMRLDGSFTQYYETEMNGDRITMMQPELTGGVRVSPDGPTRVWLEGGVMYLKTRDPRGSSSITGPTVGVRVEQRLSRDLALLGTVERAFLPDRVTAWAGRVGVRFHHVEAAFRVLDLNVGPALYGPELGVGF